MGLHSASDIKTIASEGNSVGDDIMQINVQQCVGARKGRGDCHERAAESHPVSAVARSGAHREERELRM